MERESKRLGDESPPKGGRPVAEEIFVMIGQAIHPDNSS